MNKCPNCGAEVEDGHKFCGNCGQPIFQNQKPTEAPIDETPVAPAPAEAATPVDATPVNATPVAPAPAEAATPADATPVNPTPIAAAPAATPVDAAPAQSTSYDSQSANAGNVNQTEAFIHEQQAKAQQNHAYTDYTNNANAGTTQNQANPHTDFNGYANQTSSQNGPQNGPLKSRTIAGLLGIFLGGLGIHNFYLGYNTKAIIQCAVSVVCILLSCCTLGISLIISLGIAIWGLVEGVMILSKVINVDGYGRPLDDK